MKKDSDNSPKIMTVPEVARYLHLHATTVYKLLKNKDIPAFKLGSDWRFEKTEIDRWVNELAKRGQH